MVGSRLDGKPDIREVTAKGQKACREKLDALNIPVIEFPISCVDHSGSRVHSLTFESGLALDCAKMSTALSDMILYKGEMGKGASLGRNVAKALEFEPALPDSVAELLLFRVCIPPEQQKLLMQGDPAKPAASAPKPAPDAKKP